MLEDRHGHWHDIIGRFAHSNGSSDSSHGRAATSVHRLAAAPDGVSLSEDFGPDGAVKGHISSHEDGSFQIHANDNGRPERRVHLASAHDAEELRSALESAWEHHRGKISEGEESGDGWNLVWDGQGATLYGDFHDSGMRLTRDDVESLESALSDIQSRAESYDSLSHVAPLRADENLAGKKKFGDIENPLGVALVHGPDGHTVRLAPIGALDPDGSGKELKNYTGGEGHSSAILDAAATADLRENLDLLRDEAGARKDYIEAAAAQAEGPNGEFDDSLFQSLTADLGTGPSITGQGHDIDGYFGEQRETETPWGTVVAQGYSDEFGEWTVHLGVRPHGAVQNADWSLDGIVRNADGSYASIYDDSGKYTGFQYVTLAQGSLEIPYAVLEPKDVKALIKYLSAALPA